MRNKRLDILRCIAILLVIFEHGHIFEWTDRAGWIGVDLFFVLSGFLISGLLFREYQRTGSIRLKRFFVRRGFKIYPAFYVYLAFIAFVQHTFLRMSPLATYVHEIFFVQNYLGGIFGHTWSLAVEEHFYIFLPLFLLLLVKSAPSRADPFRWIPWAFLSVAVLCQVSRAISAFVGPPNYNRIYYATHNRIDSLFFGVLIGYFYHFRLEILDRLMRPVWTRVLMAVFSVAFLSSAYWFDRETWFFGAIGYVLIYLGCGGLLLLSLFVHNVLPKPLTAVFRPVGTSFARVGMYSYSIYLWHGPVGAYLVGRARTVLHLSLGPYQKFALFFVESLVVGIAMSVLIEYPILHIRNRLFPSAATAAVPIPELSASPVMPDVPAAAQ
jgi:peptidoglycan/LPS O-acetylase OafA/YrhL